jgi:hypothetical protein
VCGLVFGGLKAPKGLEVKKGKIVEAQANGVVNGDVKAS